jgi:hypothetical protein
VKSTSIRILPRLFNSLGKATLHERGYISASLGHGYNLHGLGCCAVDDEISAHRAEKNRQRGQILSLMTNARCFANRVERREKLPNPFVGGINTIFAI